MLAVKISIGFTNSDNSKLWVVAKDSHINEYKALVSYSALALTPLMHTKLATTLSSE